MGYNTVAFLLNDMMHDLMRCPKAIAYALSHPPMSDHPQDKQRWWDYLCTVARENNEPIPSHQALNVLGTFHASDTTYLRAGGNCIEKLNVVRYGKDRKTGKNTVTLELPEWWDRKHHG